MDVREGGQISDEEQVEKELYRIRLTWMLEERLVMRRVIGTTFLVPITTAVMIGEYMRKIVMLPRVLDQGKVSLWGFLSTASSVSSQSHLENDEIV